MVWAAIRPVVSPPVHVAGALLLGLLLIEPIAAQDEPIFRAFTTGDGTRFLVVPHGDAPVVHWVVQSPAGLLEDPPEAHGLAHAVARSSLRGTSTHGSRDWPAERTALAEEDALEQETEAWQAAGKELPAELSAKLLEARAKTARLQDPLAWQRALRDAPSLGAVLSESDDACFLHVTTTIDALPRVAELLRERRTDMPLRGLHDEYRAVLAALRQRAQGPRATLEGELAELAFSGHPYARLGQLVRLGEHVPVARELGSGVWQRTQDPRRTLHVLTGGFDADHLRELLQKSFAAPAPAGGVAAAATVPRPTGSRSSEIRGRHPGVALGIRLESRWFENPADQATLAAMVEWLGGEDGILARALRAAGQRRVQVRVAAPFPSIASPGLLLLEASDEAGTARVLHERLEAALALVAQQGPDAGELLAAHARVGARALAARLGPEALALELARLCGVGGLSPAQALLPPAPPAPGSLQEFVRLLQDRSARTTILQEGS